MKNKEIKLKLENVKKAEKELFDALKELSAAQEKEIKLAVYRDCREICLLYDNEAADKIGNIIHLLENNNL